MLTTKKILLSLLFASFMSNFAIEAAGKKDSLIDKAVDTSFAIAIWSKIAAEAISINGLTKTTPESVVKQQKAEIFSNGVTAALALMLLHHTRSVLAAEGKGSSDVLNFAYATGFAGSIAALVCSAINIYKVKDLFENRHAISRYRENPKVQAALAQIKSKQRRWILANYLLPIITCLAALICNT